jgi:hypothetical protein
MLIKRKGRSRFFNAALIIFFRHNNSKELPPLITPVRKHLTRDLRLQIQTFYQVDLGYARMTKKLNINSFFLKFTYKFVRAAWRNRDLPFRLINIYYPGPPSSKPWSGGPCFAAKFRSKSGRMRGSR